MDAEGFLAIGIATICLFAVGATATAIESSVETTPDDAIDIGASSVPLGDGEIQAYKERVKSDGESGDSDGETRATAPADGEGSAGERSRAAQTGDPGATAAPAEGFGTGASEPALLDRLLALVHALLERLVSLLPAAALVAVLGGGVVYRDRLRGALGREESGSGTVGSGEGTPTLSAAAPTNEVSRAWHEMATKLDDSPGTKTPRELVDAAVSAGVDREPVERVTRAFEEVRYGHAEATEERCQRARRGLQTVRAQYRRDR